MIQAGKYIGKKADIYYIGKKENRKGRQSNGEASIRKDTGE